MDIFNVEEYRRKLESENSVTIESTFRTVFLFFKLQNYKTF